MHSHNAVRQPLQITCKSTSWSYYSRPHYLKYPLSYITFRAQAPLMSDSDRRSLDNMMCCELKSSNQAFSSVSKVNQRHKVFYSYPIRIRISSFATTKTLFGVYDLIQIQLLLVVMYVIYLPLHLHLWIWQMFLSIHCIKGILYILSVHAFPGNQTHNLSVVLTMLCFISYKNVGNVIFSNYGENSVKIVYLRYN